LYQGAVLTAPPLIHKFLEINQRDEVALKSSLPHVPTNAGLLSAVSRVSTNDKAIWLSFLGVEQV
jgi:hypothetical protein